jgi:hypothetical protein
MAGRKQERNLIVNYLPLAFHESELHVTLIHTFILSLIFLFHSLRHYSVLVDQL